MKKKQPIKLSVWCAAALSIGAVAITTQQLRGAENDAPTKFRKRMSEASIKAQSEAISKISVSKRLLLSAEGSADFEPFRVNRTNVARSKDGEIWLTVSYDDGTPFNQAKARDIQIETLRSEHDDTAARLDVAGSRPEDGVWHFRLPQLNAGSHFYRINITSDIAAWKTSYEGHVVVRANYTRMPYWNAQRIDGTIWEPPH